MLRRVLVISIGGGMPLAALDQFDPATGLLLIPEVLDTRDGFSYSNVTIVVGSVISIGD
jgi:hypothetical protein